MLLPGRCQGLLFKNVDIRIFVYISELLHKVSFSCRLANKIAVKFYTAKIEGIKLFNPLIWTGEIGLNYVTAQAITI